MSLAAAPRDDAPAGRAPSADAPSVPPSPPAALAAVRPRADGWTPQRQHDFIEALADTGSVARAAASVGMSGESAYRLRRRADARVFAEAWEEAHLAATHRLADAALERAIHGEEVPVFHQGELVGTRVRHSDALAIFLLRMRDPIRYGALAVAPREALLRVADASVFDSIGTAVRALPRLLGRLLLGGAAPAPPAPVTDSGPGSAIAPPPRRSARVRATAEDHATM